MDVKITILDYFRMPFFRENWISFVALYLPIIAFKLTLFKGKKISLVYLALILLLSMLATLPLQSYFALKLWRLSDFAVLYVVYPFTSLVISSFLSYGLMKLKSRK